MFVKQNVCSKKLLTNKYMFDIMPVKKQMFVSYVRTRWCITDFSIMIRKRKMERCKVMYRVMYQRNIGNGKELLRRRRAFLFGFVLFVVLSFFSIVFITKTVTAEREMDRAKKITSVQIKKGDTLWSIAKSYISDEYNDIDDYIDEIKTSNGLSSDTIHAGNYIIVPYYTDASK
ncbi:MAG: LysM peptidoglycan-binding domain-containing protein [Lachnospiraceae bacterium]|nr:LysM peptidoglycan-binding domain-containing protein [Lachnospiraceae bacterium]